MLTISGAISYFNKFIDQSMNTSQIDELNAQIDLVKKSESELQTIIDNRFEIKLPVTDINDLMDYCLERVKLVHDCTDDENLFRKYVYMLNFNFDSELDIYKKGREAFSIIMLQYKATITRLSSKIKKLKSLNNNDEANLLQRIIVKTNNDLYRISGAINNEEYNKIVELMEKLNIPIAYRMEFVNELNESIAKYKAEKEKIELNIEKEELSSKMEEAIQEESPMIVPQPMKKRIAPYDYKRIINAMDYLNKHFDCEIENPRIDASTPYDSSRIDLYYNPDNLKEVDFNTVLYDLKTFIDPKKIEGLYDKGIIKNGKELDHIRNKVYTFIYKEVDKYKEKQENKHKATQNNIEANNSKLDITPKKVEMVVPEAVPVHVTTKKDVEEPQIIELNRELDDFEDIKKVDSLPYFTDEELKELNNTMSIAEQYVNDFERLFRVNQSIVDACLKYNDTYTYDFSLEMATLVGVKIKKFIKNYHDYFREYENYKNDPYSIDEDSIFLLEDDKNALLSLSESIVDEIELLPLDRTQSNEPNVQEYNQDNNIVVLYQSPDSDVSIVKEDIDDITYLGQTKAENIKKEIETLRKIDTNSFTENQQNKYVRNPDRLPYNQKFHDVRYAIDIGNICDENKRFLMDYYNMTNPDIKLIIVYMVFFHDYTDSKEINRRLNAIGGRQSYDVGSIGWIEEIFKNPFTEETKKIAINLINNSNLILNTLDNERSEATQSAEGGTSHGQK